MPKSPKQYLAEFGNRVGVLGNTVAISNNLAITQGSDILLQPTSGVFANATFGVAGQVLTTNGSAVYWSGSGGGGGGISVGNYGAITVDNTNPGSNSWVLNNNIVGPANLSNGAPSWSSSNGWVTFTGATPVLYNVSALNSGTGKILYITSATNSMQFYLNGDAGQTGALNVAEFNTGGMLVKSGDVVANTVTARGGVFYAGDASASFYRTGAIIGFATSNTNYAQLQNGTMYVPIGYSPSSDIKLKKDIVNIEKDYAIEKIRNIQGVTYNRKDIENLGRQIGFIANHVEKIIPEVVSEIDISENKDGSDKIKTLSYTSLIPILWEAIKYLDEENTKLNQKVDSLMNSKTVK